MKLCWDNIENLHIPRAKHAKVDFVDYSRKSKRKYYIMKCEYCGDDCLVNIINIKQNNHYFCNLSCANKFKDHPTGKDHPCWGKQRPDARKRMLENNPTKCGSLNPNWKGGYRSDRQKIMGRKEYSSWRTSVYERDDYICQECGKKGNETGGYLNAHHIKKYSEFPELLFDVNNGITLCQKCHRRTQGKEHLFEEKYLQMIQLFVGVLHQQVILEYI